MATVEPKPVKQLRELLQEEQEPFTPEIHLIETGYLKKSLNMGSSSISCHGNSSKSLARTLSHGTNKSKKRIPHYPNVTRVVYDHFISIKAWLRSDASNRREGQLSVNEESNNNRQAAESDRFPTASSTTVFNSCSESDVQETSTSRQKKPLSFTANASQSFQLSNPIEKEATTERKLQRPCIENRKQHSPVSVLQEMPSPGGSPYLNNQEKDFKATKEDITSNTGIIFPNKITDDSILSDSLLNFFFRLASEKSIRPAVEQEFLRPSLSSHNLKPKLILQQTEQLLFGCVREVADNHGKKQSQQRRRGEYLGTVERGTLVNQKIKSSGKQYGDAWNLKNLLHLDLLTSAQDWNDCDKQRMEIGVEIGDEILEGIMNETVTHMIDSVTNYQKLC